MPQNVCLLGTMVALMIAYKPTYKELKVAKQAACGGSQAHARVDSLFQLFTHIQTRSLFPLLLFILNSLQSFE